MRTLVLGAGGIGGYFGGRLVQVGADVTFLVRAARAELLRQHGLVIESPLGDARLQVSTVSPADLKQTYDLVVLSCKAYDLDDAISAIRPAVGPTSTVLPLLNGVAHFDQLDSVFGTEQVVGGIAHISSTLAPDGHIRHLGKLSSITFGERSPSQNGRCDAIEGLLTPAAFESRRSADIRQDLWEKFAFITAAAAITCLMRAPIGDILDATDGEAFILDMLRECEAVAAASGSPVRAKAQHWARSWLTQRGSDFTASMLRDIRNGSRTEANHILGDMMRRGDALSTDVRLLRIALTHLQAYEAARSRL